MAGWSSRRGIVCKPNGQLARIIFLHDFFREIPLGAATLEIELSVSKQVGEEITISGQVRIDIRDTLGTSLERDLARIHDRLEKESHLFGNKDEIIRSVANIESRHVIPILVDSLRFQADHVTRIHELCRRFDHWEPLVDHLVEHGSYKDFVHFQNWESNAVVLSDDSVARLFGSKNLWVKVYAYSTFGKRYLSANKDRDLEFLRLEYEIRILGKAVEKLKEELQGALKVNKVEDETLMILMFE